MTPCHATHRARILAALCFGLAALSASAAAWAESYYARDQGAGLYWCSCNEQCTGDAGSKCINGVCWGRNASLGYAGTPCPRGGETGPDWWDSEAGPSRYNEAGTWHSDPGHWYCDFESPWTDLDAGSPVNPRTDAGPPRADGAQAFDLEGRGGGCELAPGACAASGGSIACLLALGLIAQSLRMRRRMPAASRRANVGG